MENLVKILLAGIAVVLFLMIGGGFIAGQAAEGYARGGGSLEARVLSPSNEATGGNNSVVISVQGDDNHLSTSYQRAEPEQPSDGKTEEQVWVERGMAGALMILVCVVVIGFLLAALLGVV